MIGKKVMEMKGMSKKAAKRALDHQHVRDMLETTLQTGARGAEADARKRYDDACAARDAAAAVPPARPQQYTGNPPVHRAPLATGVPPLLGLTELEEQPLWRLGNPEERAVATDLVRGHATTPAARAGLLAGTHWVSCSLQGARGCIA
jgi:hypothetical protein